MQTLPMPGLSASTLSFRVSPPLFVSLRPVKRETPRQPLLHTHYREHRTAVAALGRRGGTEYSCGTCEISPSLVNGSRNDLLALTLLLRIEDPKFASS